MIPLSIPNLSEVEQQMVQAAVASGWISSAGPEIAEFEQQMAKYCGVRFGVAVSSGTAALHLAMLVAGVGPEDLVLAPNLTFVASLNAIAYTGARPVLVDAAPDSIQMDLDLVADFLESETAFRNGQCFHKASGKRIAAVMPVHLLGYCCDMQRLRDLASGRGIPVIEDAAEALGARYSGQHLGSFGLVGCLSFNGNKVLSTGGGGMLLTNDQRLAEYAKHLSTQAKSFSEEYLHDAVGYNYRMPNLNAALGLAQLTRLDGFLARKREVYAFYTSQFAELDALHTVTYDAAIAAPGHWLHTIFTPEARQLQEFLVSHGVSSRKLWVPMNRLPMYRDCMHLSHSDHSYRHYEHSLSLPSSTGITDAELVQVATAVKAFFKA